MATTTDASKLQQSFEHCIESLTWSLEKAKSYVEDFDKCLQEAVELRGKGVPFDHQENPIKAIDSFVHLIPTGVEKGNFYAIDLGGTNLRAVCVKLEGEGANSTIQKQQNIRQCNVTKETPKGLLDANTPAVHMFDAIASLTHDLMKEVGDDPADERYVSFTFSFPTTQHSLANGELVVWTKEFETGKNTNDPVEGQDVAELLNASFKRKGMACIVGAVANDTVGTLLSAGYENNKSLPTTRVGVILGTGFNIAAFDPAAQQNGYSGSIVNYECGNYNGADKFLSVMDMELDYNSGQPGFQLAEKMISGHYLGEICRLAFLKVFQYRAPQKVWDVESLGTEQAAAIYADNTKRYKVTQQVIRDIFDWEVTDESELRFIYKIVCAVFDRSATVAALMTSVMANRSRFLQRALGGVTVGVDGSLYLKNSKYRKTYRKTIDKILGSRSEFLHIVTANDGSGKGAAVIAACQQTQQEGH